MCSASVRAPYMFSDFSSASLPSCPATSLTIDSGNMALSLMQDAFKIFSWNCKDFSLKHFVPSVCSASFDPM